MLTDSENLGVEQYASAAVTPLYASEQQCEDSGHGSDQGELATPVLIYETWLTRAR